MSDDNLMALDALQADAARPGERLDHGDGLPEILGENGELTMLIQSVLPNAKPVRTVLFSKSEATNWAVPWHQDRVITVADRCDVVGYSNWSRKGGTWHCEPPMSVLDNMLFVRVHLDDADAENGAMEIALSSHKCGRVAAEEAEALATQHETELCIAGRGDVQVLKMGMLHRSRPSSSRRPRRAVRVDFTADHLAAPLQWA
ncbi:MAG: phytanoyl-CoA dioxygenase family protein [Pseudomonadota bacterium]